MKRLSTLFASLAFIAIRAAVAEVERLARTSNSCWRAPKVDHLEGGVRVEY